MQGHVIPRRATTPENARSTVARLVMAALLVAATLASASWSPLPVAAAESGPDGRSVERLYQAYFLRPADTNGLAYWNNQRQQGLTLTAISEQFAQSDEFTNRYGTLDNAAFITLIYNNLFDRTPDTGGLTHWTNQLNTNTLTRGAVMLNFSDSAEYKETTGIVEPLQGGPDGRSVERLYQAYFLRPADTNGLAYWNNQRQQGLTLTAISEQFAQSDEFTNRYGTLDNAAFITLIYNNLFDRTPDTGGLTHWTNQLNTNTLTRGAVMLNFSDSAEYKETTGIHGDAPPPNPTDLPTAGNPNGTAAVPPEAQAVDTSSPDHVIGTGSPASCTSTAFVAAVAQGGTIVFDCGPDPVTILMEETAKIRNDADPDVVIDGGGLVTLSGGGDRRILYMNTCDQAQVWTTSHCQNQDHPRLTVQNLDFVDGNSIGETAEGGGGGAIFVRGGRLKIVNSVFARNRCEATGPDIGGAAVRVLSQYNDLPVYVTNSTFGGAPGQGNICSNGGGLSSIGVSFTVINSLFSHNDAIGNGANPAQNGTPGGGSGGAIYNDGGTFTLTVVDTVIEDNHANEGGGAIFFVSNNRGGHLLLQDSILRRNPSDGFETDGLPGIFYLGSGPAQVSGSSLS